MKNVDLKCRVKNLSNWLGVLAMVLMLSLSAGCGKKAGAQGNDYGDSNDSDDGPETVMTVVAQLSMPDVMMSMKAPGADAAFVEAVQVANDKFNKESDDFVGVFVDQYLSLKPDANLAEVFPRIVAPGANKAQAVASLKGSVNERTNAAARVLTKRVETFGVASPKVEVLSDKQGQIKLELAVAKGQDRVRDLIQRSANVQFFETYLMEEIGENIGQIDQVLAKNGDGNALASHFFEFSGTSTTPLVGATTASDTAAINQILRSDLAKKYLPSNVKFGWERTGHEVVDPRTEKEVVVYGLIALRTSDTGAPAIDGSYITKSTTHYDDMMGNVIDIAMNDEGAKLWERITKNNIGKSMAIVVDDQVYSYPYVSSVIEGGRSQITGSFSAEEAEDLANVINSGKLNARIEILSYQTGD